MRKFTTLLAALFSFSLLSGAAALVRKLAAVLTVLIAFVLFLGAAYMSVGTIAGSQPSQRDQGFACPDSLTLTDATVAVTADLVPSAAGTPTLKSSVEVSLPRDWSRAADILGDPDSVAYRNIVSCLLGRNADDIRYTEEVAQPVSVSVEATRIVIKQSVEERVDDNSTLNVGFLNYSSLDSQTSRITLLYPYLLTRADWTFAINVPGGSLGNVTPWPPTTLSQDSASWAPLIVPTDAYCPNGLNICSNVDVTLPVADQALLLGARYPWNMVSTVLGSASFVLVLGWTYWALGRSGLSTQRRKQIRRCIEPALAISAWDIAIFVANRALVGLDVGVNYFINTCESLSWVLLLTFCAIRWHLSRSGTLLASVSAIMLLTTLIYYMYNADQWAFNDTDPPPVLFAQVQACASLIIITLLFAGICNSVRVTFGLRRQYWCWLVGLALAGSLLIERVWIKQRQLESIYWASLVPPKRLAYFADLDYFVTDVIDSSLWLALAPVAVSLAWNTWMVAKLSSLGGDSMPLRSLAALTFVMVPAWDVRVFINWTVPIQVLLAMLTFYSFRRFKSILDAKEEGVASPLASEVARPQGLQDLRDDARVWRTALREARSAEKKLHDGEVTTTSYIKEMGALESFTDVQERVDGNRSKPGRPRIGLKSKYNPIDIVMAVGPGGTPKENAKYALKVSLTAGVPASVGMMALATYQWPFDSALILRTALLPLLGRVFWSLIVPVSAGLVVGVLWQHLPGRRGPIRVLPVALIYAFVPLLQSPMPVLTGGRWEIYWIVDALVFFAIATIVGVAMDLRSLRETRWRWQKGRQVFALVYGLDNASAQLAFWVAQVAAIGGLVAALLSVGDASSTASGGGITGANSAATTSGVRGNSASSGAGGPAAPAAVPATSSK